MFARPGALADRLSVGLLRGVLIGFSVASIFGVPPGGGSRSDVLGICVLATDRTAGEGKPRQFSRRRPKGRELSRDRGAVAVHLIHAGVTLAGARGDFCRATARRALTISTSTA